MRSRQRPPLWLLGALTFLAAGCLQPDPDPASEGGPSAPLVGRSAAAVGARCDATGCGVNGPETDGHGFGDLNTYGKVNSLGYFIAGVAPLGRDILDLRVEETALVGQTRSDANVVGEELIGVRIIVRHEDVPAHYWTLRIADYADVTTYWVGSDTQTIPSYEIAIRMDKGPWVSLCNEGVISDYEQIHHAFVFEGDRYDQQQKRVRDDHLDTGWFNIACTGATANKLLRLRHAQVAAEGDLAASAGDRTAMYKALVGDFCGTGESLTEPGVPLFTRLEQAWGWNHGCLAGTHEAVWNQDGAMCIDTYRLAGDPMEATLEACGIPDCSADVMLEFWLYGWTRTTNPSDWQPDTDDCIIFAD